MFEMFSYENRIKQRTQLVNCIHKYLKHNTKVPKEVLAFMIKCWHCSIFYIVIVLCLFAPKFLGILGLSISAFFVPLYVYFDGCFISFLEHKILKKNFVNVIDPYLGLFGYDINDSNRIFITPLVVGTYFIFTIFILLYRFHKDFYNLFFKKIE
jgi:hypothetical protein